MRRFAWGLIIAIACALLWACGGPSQNPEAADAAATPSVAPTKTSSPTASASPTPVPTETAAPTDTPVHTFTPVPTPQPTRDCLHGADHPKDVFTGGKRVMAKLGYTSDTVSIRIQKIVNPNDFPRPMVIFVADIYLEDITCLRSAWSKDTLQGSAMAPMDILAFMEREKALLMINGDYISKWEFGCVVKNGEVVRQVDTPRYDACVLLKDGTMRTLEGTESQKILELDPWQAWCFGPALLDENGKAKTSFHSNLQSANPRTAIGYYAPGHYCFVVVEGRRDKYSKGMTMYQLAKFMESLGCKAAYNLDGGSSSVMAFDGQRVSDPPYYRNIPDVIYIVDKEPRKENETNVQGQSGQFFPVQTGGTDTGDPAGHHLP